MIEFAYGFGPDPLKPIKGRWQALQKDNGVLTAETTCPQCGNFGSLAKHTIGPDGTVTPSYLCPWSKEAGCTFHDTAKLLGWPDACREVDLYNIGFCNDCACYIIDGKDHAHPCGQCGALVVDGHMNADGSFHECKGVGL